MARTQARPKAPAEQSLHTCTRRCPSCRLTMWSAYTNCRTVTILKGPQRFRLHVRRCQNPSCSRYHRPYRPEEEGRIALPQHEFGLEVIALVGALRYQQHRSVPEIHQELVARGVGICERSVTNLLDRYDELVSLCLADSRRWQKVLQQQGRVILALDGLPPDVGHEVLWVLRDGLSGEVLLARSLLSSTEDDLASLMGEVKRAWSVPIVGAVSDGQHSLRNAVATALPKVAHQLCHFHYLREAARPIYEADRHAQKELQKRVRGIRPLERRVEARQDTEANAIRGYCSAVRSAITDDGRPPGQASGRKLRDRLSAISTSLNRVRKKGGSARNWRSSKTSWTAGWPTRPRCGPLSRPPSASCLGPRPFSTILASSPARQSVGGIEPCWVRWPDRPIARGNSQPLFGTS